MTPKAASDLEAIWQFIGRDSVRHADLVEEAIFATCRLAAANHGLGHSRVTVRNPNVRFLAVSGYKKYAIAYLVGTSPLRVLRVLHGARDIPKLFR